MCRAILPPTGPSLSPKRSKSPAPSGPRNPSAGGKRFVLEKTEVAGPGFLNFTMSADWLTDELRRLLAGTGRLRAVGEMTGGTGVD
jgi:hypothetical protein